MSKRPGDDGVRMAPSLVKPVNGNGAGHGANGNGSPTAPLPKAMIDHQLPDNIGMKEAQALLGRKLDEACVIIRELEKRTGLRFMLSRNLTLVVNLSEH